MTAETVDFAAARLVTARARLLLERPFLGSLVMYLPLKQADGSWCKTVATDARAVYYNPLYVVSRPLAELQFLLAHEALHCALGHGYRRNHRLKRPWDAACDHAVNLLLTEEGMRAPPGCLVNPAYRGLSAEEIYPLISKTTEEEPVDLHAFNVVGRDAGALGGSRPYEGSKAQSEVSEESGWSDAGNVAPSAERAPAPEPVPSLLQPDARELARVWSNRLIAAAQAARSHGALGRTWQQVVDHTIAPQVPWHAVLATRLMALAGTDYSFQRPSRRESDACLPSLQAAQPRIVIALDTSGSVSGEEMRIFAREVDALKGQIRARITLLACDERLAEDAPWEFPPEKPFLLPDSLGGGGGTRFNPVFEWLEQSADPISLLVYFTDAMGDFPDVPPLTPVLWLVKGNAPVPWGERIQLN